MKPLAVETWLMVKIVCVQNAMMNNSCAEAIGACLNLFGVSLTFQQIKCEEIIALTRIGICLKMLRID